MIKPMTDNDYQAQSDSDTLMRAHEIKSDKPRHKAAIKHTVKKAKALTAVAKANAGVLVDPKTAANLQTGSFPSIGTGQ